jgi:multidrug transporter EmrE-like cation transporter
MNEPTELPGPNDRALTTEKGSRRMLIGLILVSVTIAALAQLALKSGVDHVTDAQGGALRIDGESLKALLTSPRVWFGLVLFGLAAVSWLFALSRASLSFAYPFAALGYVLIVAFSILVLHESVPPLRWLGVACIVIGIVLVAQTPHA